MRISIIRFLQLPINSTVQVCYATADATEPYSPATKKSLLSCNIQNVDTYNRCTFNARINRYCL